MTTQKDSHNAEFRTRARHRSPNYPGIGLRAAVERVRKLYQADGKAGAPREAAIRHLGYSSESGRSKTVLSALKKFGLIEDRGGKVTVSRRAIDILAFSEDHPRHTQALRSAALEPDIYAELVRRHQEAGRLPSDVSLKPELIADMGFNPKSVDGFLSEFRDTLQYAGILEGNRLLLSEQEPEKELEGMSASDDADMAEGTTTAPPPPAEREWEALSGSGLANRPAVSPSGQHTLNLLIGFTEDEEPIYGHISFNMPVKKGFLQRLGKQLEALEAGANPQQHDLPR